MTARQHQREENRNGKDRDQPRTSRSTESSRTRTGEEGFGRGGWFSQFGGKDREAWAKVALDEALGAEALLLGRRSYEYFAGTVADPGPASWADRLNSLPKYVVSSTLEDPDWNNSTVLKGDVVNEVSKLKQQLDGDIVVYASYQLVRTLMEHDLVDELRLMVFPVVLGAGRAPLRRDRRAEAHAPRRHPDHR